MSPLLFYFAHLVVLAYAFVGGVFLAFSDFIMRSLALTSGQGGAEAMQVINKEVFRWVFMALFLGLAIVSVVLIVLAVFAWSGSVAILMGMAGLVYLIGCFGVTAGFNVPMNEALADMDVSTSATLTYWSATYVPRWTIWNTVRTVACALSAALLLFGLTSVSQGRAV